ncbi:MAG: glycine/betaine ABC transporter substrate-binding protein, partial [Blastococcus sp.]|nr:glycine/betaine ABC transporter substrate-binding protein [Blastococcus sp.]
MRKRARFVLPLALAAILTTACGESGSSGDSGGGGGSTEASGDACAPIAGDELVVLEDDKELQAVDNIIPMVATPFAEANPAVIETLNSISEVLTTED